MKEQKAQRERLGAGPGLLPYNWRPPHQLRGRGYGRIDDRGVSGIGKRARWNLQASFGFM